MNYADNPAVNWSSLKYMSTSPRMYRYRLANPEPRKASWVLGGAIHCLVLEPGKFADRYITLDAEMLEATAPGRGSKEGKALVAEHPEFATANMTADEYKAACVALAYPGKEQLSMRLRAIAESARDAIMEHRTARELLRGGLAEEAVTWTDATTGIKCKGRLDYLRPDLVIDLKSSKDPTPSKFERDAVSYGYVSQAAFYYDGAKAAKRLAGDARPVVVAVRAKDDFDVACFRLTQEAIDTGRAIYRNLLHRLAECEAANYWPGVAPEIRDLNLPPWAITETIDSETSEDF